MKVEEGKAGRANSATTFSKFSHFRYEIQLHLTGCYGIKGKVRPLHVYAWVSW